MIPLKEMSKGKTKRYNIRIHKNTTAYNKSHKKECSFNNWRARLIALLDYGKRVWPMPSQNEQDNFIRLTNHKPQLIKLKGGNNKNAYKPKSF